jgi:pimeloyl-ACP methyl ester carboxylesterase
LKKNTFFWAGATALAGAAALTTVGSYRQWKHSEEARSQALSSIAVTAAGPVEYALQGQGPVMLIVHGSPGGYDHGIGLAGSIDSDDFTYLAPSRPGYLRTPLSSGISPEAQADLYAALLDTLHIEQAIVLAISGGGPSALQFALRHPQRCRGLLVLCTVTQRYIEREVYRPLPPGRRLLKQITNELLLNDPCIYALQSLVNLQPNPIAEAGLLSVLSLASLRKEGYRNDLRQFAAMTAYPLTEITVPTFIAHGTADTDVPFAHAQALAAALPQAHFFPIEGAGHLFFMTHAQQVRPALRDFLYSLS